VIGINWGILSVTWFPIRYELKIITHLTGSPIWEHAHAIPTFLNVKSLRDGLWREDPNQSAMTTIAFHDANVAYEWESSKIKWLHAVLKYLFLPYK